MGILTWRELGKADETGLASATTASDTPLTGSHALSAAAVSVKQVILEHRLSHKDFELHTGSDLLESPVLEHYPQVDKGSEL